MFGKNDDFKPLELPQADKTEKRPKKPPVAMPAKAVTGELTSTEREEFDKLRNVVRKGLGTFVQVGKALKRIRDKQLFREHQQSFEEFLSTEWDISKSYAHRQIAAADVVEILGLSPNGDTVLSEAVVRPLTKLKRELAKACWERVISGASKGEDGKAKVTAEAVKLAVVAMSPKRAVKRKKGKKLRPVTIRVDGATVVVKPTRADVDVAAVLAQALKEYSQPVKKAA